MKVFLLIGKNILEEIRDIRRNSLFFFLPIAIFFCLFLYFKVNDIEVNFIKPLQVGVVVEDETIYTQMLVDDFESKKDLSRFFILREGQADDIEEAFNQGQLDGMIVIPEGFFAALLYFDEKPMEISIRNDDPIKATILYNGFLAYEQYIISVEKSIIAFYESFRPQVSKEDYYAYNDALSIELIMMMLNRNDLYDYEEIVELPSASSLNYYFVAMMVMFVFLMALFLGTRWISERQADVFSRLRLTRVKAYEYVVSRFIGDWMVIGILVGGWFLLFALLSGTGGMTLKAFLFVMILALGAIGVSGLIALFLNELSDMVLISTMVVFFGSVLGGSIIPIHYLPDSLKAMGEWTPNFIGIRTILFLDSGISDSRTPLVVMGIVMICLLSMLALTWYYGSGIRRWSGE